MEGKGLEKELGKWVEVGVGRKEVGHGGEMKMLWYSSKWRRTTTEKKLSSSFKISSLVHLDKYETTSM